MRPTLQPAARAAHRGFRRGRLLVAALLAVALLSGCTLNNPLSNDKIPAAKAVADLSPDTASAVSAVGQIRTQAALVAAVVARFPRFAAGLSDLTALHQAQVDALIDAVPDGVATSDTTSTPTVAARPRRAVLSIETGENALRLSLIGLAATAQSGPFARLLGAMTAGIAQRTNDLRALIGMPPGQTTFSYPADDVSGDVATPASTEALQAALAGEHAAVYLTGVYGAQASKSRQPALYRALLAAYHAHRKLRDELSVMIADRGAEPVAAKVAYELPTALGTTSELNDAALNVERRIAETYGQLVENTAGAERRWALVALDNAAVRQMEFRGTPEMFPSSTS